MEMDVGSLPKVHRIKASVRAFINGIPIKDAVGPRISKRDITLTIYYFFLIEQAMQFSKWSITFDLGGQIGRNRWFISLQFDCIGNFESSQALSEQGECTVARDIFRVEKNLNKARRQAVTIIDEKES